jgi:hypothetical protein
MWLNTQLLAVINNNSGCRSITKLESPKTKAVVSPKSSNVKSESPENKPSNGQEVKNEIKDEKTSPKKSEASPTRESPKKPEANTLKIQSAGSGQKGADYNPGKKNYDPIKDAFWKKGEK